MVEWATDRYATYWICITNLTQPVRRAIEGRYAVLGW